MAKVSLRLYNREIEKIIDNSQIDEAIGHCKHILQSYPKHVETYRLLGKAYLENQRYGEATDIFQRVLSSTPDDFVAHIGLSIIREDEGNLDGAIWHMERAYEVQPSNGAIQDELRRLHGRRDGLEPPRIRLTRGALVRMYSRGDLYQQAIAEIRALLAEDPQRPDMQVLLAKMCFLSGKKVEATEICGELLNKYPYCFEANRILAEILPGTARADDAQIYRQRVNALDPYYAFTTPDRPTSADIPDNAVIIERLDWQSIEEKGPMQPQWAEALGINLDESGVKAGPVPEWMPQTEHGETPPQTTQEKSPEAPVPSATPENTSKPESESLIPAWMRDIGWTESSGATQEQAPTASVPESTEAQPEGDLKPAAIPDWLQAMAPDIPMDEQNAPVDKNFESLFASFPATQPGSGEPTPVTPAPKEEAPEWQVQDAAALEEKTAPVEKQMVESEAIPEWLKDLKTEPAPQAAEELPAWMKDNQPTTSEESQAQTEPAEAMPEWLHETTEEAPAAAKTPVQPAEEVSSVAPTTVLPAIPAETPEWLKDLTSPQEITEEATKIPPEERATAISNWVTDAQETPPVVETPAPTEPAPAEQPKEELPEWLKSIAPEEPVETAAPEPAVQTPTENLSDWLNSLKETPTESIEPEIPLQQLVEPTPTPFSEPQAVPGEPLPDWIQSIVSTPEEAQEVTQETPMAAQSQSTQGEETPSGEGLPEWLTKEEPMAVEPTKEESQPAIEAQPQAEPVASLDSWLHKQESETTAETPTQPVHVKPVSETEQVQPESLQAPEKTPESMVSALPQEIATPAGKENLPDWLKELGAQPGETAHAEKTEEPLPGWMTEVEAKEETKAPEPVPAPQDQDAALAWLESLAAKQGADEETLFVKPEERLETPPAWVQEATSQAAETVPATEAPQETITTEQPEPKVSEVSEEIPPVPTPPEVTTPVEEEKPVEAEPTVEAPLPEALTPKEAEPAAVPTDEDAALAWLESLAAKQGADEATLFIKPEERLEAPPAWVQAVSTQEENVAVSKPATEKPEAEVSLEPEFAQPAEAVSEAPEQPTEVQVTPAVEAATPEAEVTTAVEPEGETVSPVPVEPVAQIEVAQAPEAQAPETALPDWLKGFETEETEAPTQPVQINLQKAQEVTEVMAESPVIVPQPAVEKPDWLTEFEQSEKQSAGLIDTQKTTAQVEETPVLPTDQTLVMPQPPVSIQPPALIPEAVFIPAAEKETTSTGEWQTILGQAQTALQEGQVMVALQNYNHLIGAGQLVEEAIHDLRDALYHYPVDVTIWQSLGDAYVRTNRLQDALDAYTKAEELLR